MMKIINYLSKPIILLLIVTLVACTEDNNSQSTHAINKKPVENILTISWDDLIPEYYRQEAFLARYKTELDKFANIEDDENNPEAIALYEKIDAEMSKMPANEAFNNKWIKIAGFIAPLNNDNGLTTEFLLVPYFGACIHTPPPPANQTILVKVAPENGIKPEYAFGAFWISGQIQIINNRTDIGESGYSINDATVDIYKYKGT